MLNAVQFCAVRTVFDPDYSRSSPVLRIRGRRATPVRSFGGFNYGAFSG